MGEGLASGYVLPRKLTYSLCFPTHLESGAPDGARDDNSGDEACYGELFPLRPSREGYGGSRSGAAGLCSAGVHSRSFRGGSGVRLGC